MLWILLSHVYCTCLNGCLIFFLMPTTSLRTLALCSKSCMGIKPLQNKVKEMCTKNGHLNPFSNKSRHIVVVERRAQARVPANIGC